MDNEVFTFVFCTHSCHATEQHYCTRREADAKFDAACKAAETSTEGDYVAYYCASVGGLVNSFRVS